MHVFASEGFSDVPKKNIVEGMIDHDEMLCIAKASI